MTTIEKIEQIIGEYKEIEPGSLKAETTFEELELDSLDLVDMAMACEDTFGKTVEVDENLKTVGDLAKILDAA
ncbi:MAG: acyl carrier protein [Ruminococcaceae bacterium]|nr:acyl carrier protein [Oscillospiraceae bacterium]